MLGFGALGQFALGQRPANTTFVLVASAATYALTISPANLTQRIPSNVGAYSATGLAALFKTSETGDSASYALLLGSAVGIPSVNGNVGSYSVAGVATAPNPVGQYSTAGVAVAFRSSAFSAFGNYSLVGKDALFRLIGPGMAASASFSVNGNNAVLQPSVSAQAASFAGTYKSASFTTGLVSVPAIYSVTGIASSDGEIWRDRTFQSEIWTPRAIEPEISGSAQGQIGFGALGEFAIGQGSRVVVNGWQDRRVQDEIWTRLN